ncbi:MAG: PilZ domain-containing protein [Candidatus Omnitrophota bacterium]
MNKVIKPLERRTAIRLPCKTLLTYKVCKESTVEKILEGYTNNISEDGLRCNLPEDVPVGCTLWLRLDRDALAQCEEIEKRAVIIQQGILGKVIWVDQIDQGEFDVGVQFLTRESKATNA